MAIAANGVAIVGGRLAHRLAATVGSSALVWYGVPLAWRNLLDDRRRLLRSTMGIAFAVLLMLVELGFRDAFLESALQIIRGFDADIVLVSATKFRFGRKDPFSRRHLYVARGSPGVASAAPVYGEWTKSLWKNPQTHKPYTVQVLAFDPDQPVFLFPDITARLSELRQPDTVVVDRRGRRFLGTAQEGTQTELAARAIRVVGTFPLGPDFTDDGTLVMSDRNFFTLFSPRTLGNHELPNIEIGIVKVLPGYPVRQVQATLQQTLGKTVSVLTKNVMIDREISFQSTVSPVGPIFAFGTAIGFAVGILIVYQILYNDLSDQLPQYATLKAMGFTNGYLVRTVLAQSVLYALIGFLPAWLIGTALFRSLSELSLLPLSMTPGITLISATLTLGMCLFSGWLALRRVLAADPAEIF